MEEMSLEGERDVQSAKAQPQVLVVEAPKKAREGQKGVKEVIVVKTTKRQQGKGDEGMVSLSELLEPNESSDDESEEESVAIALRDAKADAARLRALLDAEDDELQPEEEEVSTIAAPSLDELLLLCASEDKEITKDEKHGCFICPECLMVAPTAEVLQRHFECVHAHTWKEVTGRRQGSEGYILGDMSRLVARSLTRTSIRTQRRIQRRLAAHRESKPWYLLTGVATLGVAAAVIGAPLLGTAAIGGGIIGAVTSHHRRSRARLLDQQRLPPEDQDGTELSSLTPTHPENSIHEKSNSDLVLVVHNKAPPEYADVSLDPSASSSNENDSDHEERPSSSKSDNHHETNEQLASDASSST